MRALEVFRVALLLGGWVGSLVFVVYYHFTAKWYQNRLGRYLMSGPMGLASLYSAAVANSLIPSEVVRDVLRLSFIALTFWFAWYSVITYHQTRKEELRRRKEENGHH